MKVIAIYMMCLIATNVYSQEIKVRLAGAEYDVCTSFAYAEQFNPDSVKGFCLQSKGYKDFPKEVLKYKNIIVLDLSSKHLDEMVEYLNSSERKAYEKRLRNGGKQFGYPLFRANSVVTIPDEIINLKKLKVIHLMDMYVSIEAIKKIERLLPNVLVIPSSENLEAELKNK
ncbi:MAG: hypothetical protein IM600_03760 [Bacteroidetes bacterium]|nr:hypothetical protein [Bacteroidota bacterium]MCA6442525.1 hypothetical protein [Bacteroidota bacterium]